MAASAGQHWLICERVASDLNRLDGVFQSLVADEEAQFAELLAHLLSLGGKRLRPALLLLAASDENPGAAASDETLHAAAAVELIHIASLYHDDIMDRAETRRGAQSVNGKWGNGAAMMSGTLLYAWAQRLLRRIGLEAVQTAAAATSRLCAGQLRESENAFNQSLSITEYMTIIDEKTATLFELSVDIGCLAASVSAAEARALHAYAGALGMAFQLRDDLLDWSGDTVHVGKATQSDLRDGIYGLPILLTLEQRDERAASLGTLLKKRRLSDADITEVGKLGAAMVPEVETIMGNHVDEARRQLTILPEGPRRRSLDNLAAYCVARTR